MFKFPRFKRDILDENRWKKTGKFSNKKTSQYIRRIASACVLRFHWTFAHFY